MQIDDGQSGLRVWWRQDPLTEHEQFLLQAVHVAHQKSAFRNNASSMAVVNASVASGDLSKAIVAGIMHLGEKHAPLEQTYRFLCLEHPEKNVNWALEVKENVPGWGNSFVKGDYDPLWVGVHEILHKNFPEIAWKLNRVTEELHSHGKKIFPNPSAYTAAAAIVLGLPPKVAVYLFIRARLDAWAHLATNAQTKRGEVKPSAGEL